MIPASLAGVLFLVALVPGSIYLRRTDRKRKPGGDSSAIEEILALIVAGSITTLPPLFAALMFAPERVKDATQTARDFQEASNEDLKQLGCSLVLIFLSAIILAFLNAGLYNKFSITDAAPDIWGPTLGDDLDKTQVLVVGVKLVDGTYIQGSSGGYSTGKHGKNRDLLLSKPIYLQRPGKKLKKRAYRRLVISEAQIAYFMTTHQPRNQRAPLAPHDSGS